MQSQILSATMTCDVRLMEPRGTVVVAGSGESVIGSGRTRSCRGIRSRRQAGSRSRDVACHTLAARLMTLVHSTYQCWLWASRYLGLSGPPGGWLAWKGASILR